MQIPGFIDGAYELQSRIAAGERCVNFYFEANRSSAGKSRASLVSCPGLVEFATLNDTPGRGIFAERGRLFAVAGTTLEEIDEDGVVADRGNVSIDANPATLCENGDGGDELFVTSGDKGYSLDLSTNTLTLVVSAVTFGGQVDGFFVGLDAGTSTLKISDSLDGTTWDPTQIAQRTGASDPWQALAVCKREIYLFGEKTAEVWYNAGNAPFPFAPRIGTVIEPGVVAPFSLARFGDSLAFLGGGERGSGIVYWLNGYIPNRISNEGIEWAIQQYKDDGGISDAIGWSYESRGHLFYVLSFPTQQKTWVYDGSTNRWHERGYWSANDNEFLAYRGQFYAQAFGKDLVLDPNGNKIYQLSATTYTDAGGGVLRRVRRGPHLAQENKRLILHRFEVEAERGVGLAAGQGVDPQLLFRLSRDGGQTWGAERSRSLGARAAYTTRVVFDRCGAGRDLVPEVVVTDPVSVTLFDAYGEVEVTRS